MTRYQKLSKHDSSARRTAQQYYSKTPISFNRATNLIVVECFIFPMLRYWTALHENSLTYHIIKYGIRLWVTNGWVLKNSGAASNSLSIGVYKYQASVGEKGNFGSIRFSVYKAYDNR